MPRSLLAVVVLAIVAATLSTGCPRRRLPVETAPAQEPPPPAVEITPPMGEPSREVTEGFPTQPVETRPEAGEPIDELNRKKVLKTVYFDFDRYDLDDQDREILRQNAQWLNGNTGYRVAIEGHCDERGTIEYNLTLGERRARSVREYLTSLGVSGGRMRIISYGEERPANPGHGEAAWAENRRAEFVIEP
jgi:peptidoglycan-associated lipoprotein